MTHTIAIKNWFLRTNGIDHIKGQELRIEKHTSKAMLISYYEGSTKVSTWVPNSAIIDKWEE